MAAVLKIRNDCWPLASPNEVESCHQELKRQGVTVLEPPRDQSWGHRTLYFRDPEHNVLEIYADM